jgi:hypothetical protein
MSNIAYDVIGDIHGRFDKFEALMKVLGYRAANGSFVPPAGRQAVFVGDLLDRGPEQIRLLSAVRQMIEAGHARAVMGNHEFNAIAYVTPDESITDRNEFLRANAGDAPKCHQNRRQHAAFLAQVGEGSTKHRHWVEWFRTLPLYLDLGGIRVAHAWWDQECVDLINNTEHRDAAGRLTEEFVIESHRRGSALKKARKILTTGYEHKLPEGSFITDKEGNKHDNVRLKIWKHGAERLRDLAIVPGGDTSIVPDLPVDDVLKARLKPIKGSPIFTGHYWFNGEVRAENSKVAVLDWSAAQKGPLVAYRWDGEVHLSDDRFVVANV